MDSDIEMEMESDNDGEFDDDYDYYNTGKEWEQDSYSGGTTRTLCAVYRLHLRIDLTSANTHTQTQSAAFCFLIEPFAVSV